KLGMLSSQLGGTYLAHGREAERVEKQARQLSAESRIEAAAPQAAKADRAVNKAINSMAYDGDLLQGIENGNLKLEGGKTEELPEELRRLSPDERKQEVEKRLTQRRQIRAEIMQLSKGRAEFIKKEQAKAGVKNSFDSVVAEALKQQLAAKGFK